MSGIMGMMVGGSPGINVTMTPGDQSTSDSIATHVFALENVYAIGGTPSAYAWSLADQTGGIWSFTGATNTASATPQVASVPPATFYNATVHCDVTIAGVVYRASAFLQYFRS